MNLLSLFFVFDILLINSVNCRLHLKNIHNIDLNYIYSQEYFLLQILDINRLAHESEITVKFKIIIYQNMHLSNFKWQQNLIFLKLILDLALLE